MNEVIEWLAVADGLPDDAQTVLLAWPDAEVWLGYLDGATWFDVSAMPCPAPSWWAHVPEGPL